MACLKGCDLQVGGKYRYVSKEAYAADRRMERVARWYVCSVVAFDGEVPVIKTDKGHYHGRPLDKYVFVEMPDE